MSVSRADRSTVAGRAGNRCEYRVIHQDDSFLSNEGARSADIPIAKQIQRSADIPALLVPQAFPKPG